MPSHQILVIEDNQALAANIFEYLEPLGYEMDTAPNGVVGLHLAESNIYDAIILDIMLPHMDGWEVCRRLRQEAKKNTPIIMLTAKGELDDKIMGFKSGADDYLVKPFALAELEMRLQAIIRRNQSKGESANCLTVGDLEFYLETMEVKKCGKSISLNPTCLRLLELLMRESPRVVSREKLETEIWGSMPPDNDILRTHIYTLRSAIDKPFKTDQLKTVPRVGYRLVAKDEDTETNIT